MPFRRKFYPEAWDRMREEALARVGYQCELCGVSECSVLTNPRKTSELYPDGKPYMVYLSVAHKQQYQTWMLEAETMVLCQVCHRRYDRRFRRKPSRSRVPLGCVVVWVCQPAGRVLAADGSSLADLVEIVVALPSGTE